MIGTKKFVAHDVSLIRLLLIFPQNHIEGPTAFRMLCG
jgi:hypothetical protein